MKPCKYQYLISAFYDGEISTDEKKIVEEHLKQCSECQTFYNEITYFHALLQEVPDYQLENVLTQRILDRIEEMQNSMYAWEVFERHVRRALVVFVVVLSFFLGILYYNEPPKEYVQQQFSIISDSSASMFIVPSEEITKQDIAYVALTSQ